MDKTYSITLSDGTKIGDLKLNGNNYISSKKLTEKDFSGKLSKVTISDGESQIEYSNLELVQIANDIPDEWHIAFRELSPDELWKMKIESNVDYMYMIQGVDLL